MTALAAQRRPAERASRIAATDRTGRIVRHRTDGAARRAHRCPAASPDAAAIPALLAESPAGPRVRIARRGTSREEAKIQMQLEQPANVPPAETGISFGQSMMRLGAHARAAAPAGSAPAPARPAVNPDLPRSGDAAQAPNAASIVVIDDQPPDANTLADFLHGAGYRRVAVLSGSAFTVQALDDARPDLVLLELGMTHADAFEVLRCMQADRVLRHVPVIALAAQDDLASRLHAFEVGAADFLVKPLDAGELELRLRNALAVKAYRDQVTHTDPLTGLPNRQSLLLRLDEVLERALRCGTVGAVMEFGLDRFDQLTDALGPVVSDELMHAISRRLLAGLRDSGVVGRAAASSGTAVLTRGSNDRFAVLLPVLEGAGEAAAVAERMIERMTAPFAVGGHEVFVSCCVGTAVFPRDSTDKDMLLKQAGLARSCAGNVGRMSSRGLQFYTDELNAQSLHRLRMERELHHALERDEFRVYYQAKVDVASGCLCGAEALVRWQHPSRGLLDPGAFVTVAEDAGLIVRLGAWVLREAMRQTAEWRRSGLTIPQVAVNVSSQQLQRAELHDEVREALSEAGLGGSALCLELTESAIIDSGAQVTDTLDAIKRLGVQLSLDDFGTGYSSLTYLRRFPIDEIKIDRSFVSDWDSNADSSAIATAIISMAHALGLRVVAEGVETPEQLAVIRRSRADALQGYLFARPLSAADFSALLTRALPTTPGGPATPLAYASS